MVKNLPSWNIIRRRKIKTTCALRNIFSQFLSEKKIECFNKATSQVTYKDYVNVCSFSGDSTAVAPQVLGVNTVLMKNDFGSGWRYSP